VHDAIKTYMRSQVLSAKIRLDGRKLNEVRPIQGQFGVLPRVHGSALFQRGITQVLNVVTLGGPGDIQLIDDMFEESSKRYIHHYNFPPYSTGEIKMLRGPSRRDIGHGRLAEKALEPVLPALEDFPYFIRSVSEVQTCNGSSSMGSVCGSSMALMDAGVPIKAIVSGVAMGLIYDDETGKYEILTDIQAQEDFLGDMDFKVARTETGVTALQMDCKIKGLKLSLLGEIFTQAKVATDFIQKEMTQDLLAPRAELSPFAPMIFTFRVPVEKIREIIGKGGETIQRITKEFSVEIDITDEGMVSVTAKSQTTGQAAVAYIQKMLRGVQIGDIIAGKVIRIIDGTGAIVDLGSGKSGMIHISKIAKIRVENIRDYLDAGQAVEVEVLTVDTENNRIGLMRIEK